MEIRIAGAGKIAGGEYDAVKVSGSADAVGEIRTASLCVAGSMKTDSAVICTGEASVSGSFRSDGCFSAEVVNVGGTLKIGGKANLGKQAKISGKVSVGENIKGSEIFVSGHLVCDGGVEAEKLTARGAISVGGLLNADDIEIVYGAVGNGLGKGNSSVGAIGGSHIVVRRGSMDKKIRKLPFLSKAFGQNPTVTVTDGIEGDDISLEGVATPRVVGRVVKIGDECKIDTVEYSETLEVSPNAEVKEKIKIGTADG